jgi:hypothetical protein
MVEYYTREAPKKKKPIDKKKWLMVGLLSFVGLIVALFLFGVIFLVVSFKTYRSPKDGVELVYPSNWTVKLKPNKGVLVAFASPKENALDSVIENYNFSTYDMAKEEKEPLSTEAYADKVISQVSQTFADLKLVQRLPFAVAGHMGYKVVFRATSSVQLMLVLYVFAIEDKGYNILYLGAISRYPKDSPMMDLVALLSKVRY